MADKRAWIVETLREVAEFFGVEPSTVKGEWRPAKMPGEQGAWDLAEILRWRDARRKSPATAGEQVELDGKPVTHAKLATLEQLERYRTRRLVNDRTAGRLVDRVDAEREVAANYLRLAARLAALPAELEMELPAKVRRILKERLESKVRLLMTEIAGWHKEQDHEQPRRSAADEQLRPSRGGGDAGAPAADAAGVGRRQRRAARRPDGDADQRGRAGRKPNPGAGKRRPV